MAFVTLAEAKEMVQISHGGQDNVLQIFIDGAVSFVANKLGIILREDAGNVVETLSGGTKSLWPVALPIISVTDITDLEDNDTVLDEVFRFTQSRIQRETQFTLWNFGSLRYKVEFVAGYSPTTVPKEIKQAIADGKKVYWSNAKSI